MLHWYSLNVYCITKIILATTKKLQLQNQKAAYTCIALILINNKYIA